MIIKHIKQTLIIHLFGDLVFSFTLDNLFDCLNFEIPRLWLVVTERGLDKLEVVIFATDFLGQVYYIAYLHYFIIH